jgi:hypothetical protein
MTTDHAEFDGTGHTQEIIPVASNEVGVDAMAGNAVEGAVVGARVDAIEAGIPRSASRGQKR